MTSSKITPEAAAPGAASQGQNQANRTKGEQGKHREGATSSVLRVYTSLEELEGLRPGWDALLEKFPPATVFSTWEWLAPWWRAFAGNDQLRVLALWDHASTLVGLAPLTITRERDYGREWRILRLMGDGTHDSDNLDMPVLPGREGEFSHLILEWLKHQRREWDICRLRTLPSHSPTASRITEELQAYGWGVFPSTRPQSIIELPDTWEAYLKMLSSKERGKIGLRTRKLEKKYKVEIGKVTEESELDPALAALYELHGKHWQLRGQPGTLHVPARRQFYRELATLLLARQRLDFWLLRVDGKIVATQFGLRYRDAVFSLQEGFDPEYSPDSVGYVLRGQVLKNLIAEGIRKYDFLGGTDDSKLRWGAEIKSYLNLEFARPRTWGSLQLLLKYKSAETKAWLRKNVPALRRLKSAGRRK